MKASRIMTVVSAIALIPALFFLAFVPARAVGTETGERYYLPLFETSDTHGYLAEVSEEPYEYRLSYIADKVNDIRNGRADRTILLDGGDIYQGNALSNLLNGQSLSAAYHLMGYDAVALGNHEFDWLIENTVDADATMPDYELGGKVVENEIPVLACNLLQNGEKVSFTRDYVILEKTAVSGFGREIPVKVAVIGFADNYASSILYSNFTGLGYTIDMDPGRADQIARELEESGACDATILLCHGEAAEIADLFGIGSPIDLVLGGHTHRSVTGKSFFGMPYMQPASYSEAYARCDLAFSFTGEKVKFQGISDAETVSTTVNPKKLENNPENTDELDPQIVALTDRTVEQIGDKLTQEIGFITVSAEKYNTISGSGERATTMGNWMCSLTRRAVGAEVAFYNAGGVRTEFRLEAGADRRGITESDVHTMFPFDNKIYLYDLNYRELLQVLEYAMTDNGSTLLSRMEGINVYYSGRNILAIVRYDGIPVYENGKWYDDWADQHVLVAASDYIATSERPAFGVSNPLYLWRESDKVLRADLVDSEGAIAVLYEESVANGGLLTVDTGAHFINRVPKNLKWQMDQVVRGKAPEEVPPASSENPAPVFLIIAGALLLVSGIAFALILILVRKKRKAEKEREKET